MSQGQIDYLNEKAYQKEYGSTEKSSHHKCRRIAMQGMTGANDKIRLVMSIIPEGYYLANSCNYILDNNEIDLYCLLGFLNSKALNWFFRCFSTNSNVNGYEVDNFPIPKLHSKVQSEISELVKEISKLKQISHTANTIAIEDKIDQIVYKAYELSPTDITIIEEGL